MQLFVLQPAHPSPPIVPSMEKSSSMDQPDKWPGSKDEEIGVGEVGFTGTQNLIASQDQLKRGLKSRHIQFLALGGA